MKRDWNLIWLALLIGVTLGFYGLGPWYQFLKYHHLLGIFSAPKFDPTLF